jgi:transposase-like protein
VLETTLSQEMTEQLGHETHGRPVTGSGNVRNGTRPKTVLTEGTGQVGLDVPGTGTVPSSRRSSASGSGGWPASMRSCCRCMPRGSRPGRSAHFEEIYGASLSKETISQIIDKVVEEMQSWQPWPLDGVYAAVFIDAIMVKVRDGQVASRSVYAAIGVSLASSTVAVSRCGAVVSRIVT